MSSLKGQTHDRKTTMTESFLVVLQTQALSVGQCNGCCNAFLSTQFPLLLPGSSAPDRDKAALSLTVLKSSLQLLDANLTDHQQPLSWSGKDRYREKRQIDSKGGLGRGGMEGDDWSIWHLVNRGVLCASGPQWNRLLLYRMELVLKLQKLVGWDLRGIHSLAIHLRTKCAVWMHTKFRCPGKAHQQII